MKKLTLAALLSLVAGVVMAQSFTDINSPQYYGKTKIPKAYAAIDANFAQVESGSSPSYADLTITSTLTAISTNGATTNVIVTVDGVVDAAKVQGAYSDADGTMTISNITANGSISVDTISEKGTGGVVVEGLTMNDGAYTDTDGALSISNLTAIGNAIILSGLPTATSGLASGTVWSDSGTLKVYTP